MSSSDRRPWFGPKRIGYGLRPQTWQAWALVTVLAAVVIVLGVALS